MILLSAIFSCNIRTEPQKIIAEIRKFTDHYMINYEQYLQ